MSAMRVPRSGSMILAMLAALVAVGLLPVVFMAALVQSAESHPRPIGETLRAFFEPIRRGAAHVVDRLRY
jgi:hypothetical protein